MRPEGAPFKPKSSYLLIPPSARSMSVFCSISCAFADPVAGLALAERFTVKTGRPPEIFFRRGTTNDSAPMLAGSSCTQTISLAFAWRSNSAVSSASGNG